jgi:hypothetical protein
VAADRRKLKGDLDKALAANNVGEAVAADRVREGETALGTLRADVVRLRQEADALQASLEAERQLAGERHAEIEKKEVRAVQLCHVHVADKSCFIPVSTRCRS